MTLRKKTLYIIALTLSGLVIVLYAASQAIVLEGFARQEEEGTRQDILRVRTALDDNLSTLQGTTKDWAAWDDTYSYVVGANNDYYRSNLDNDAPFTSNKLSLMVFVDSTGKVIFSRAYDLAHDARVPVPASLAQHLSPSNPLLDHPTLDSGVKGLLSLPEGPLLIDAEPILTSDSSGPVHGTLIFGRSLDAAALQRLSRTTLLSLTAYRIGDGRMPFDFKEALTHLSGEASTFARPLSSKTVAGYILLNDIYGKPAIVFRSETPRNGYEQGQSTVLYFLGALIIVGIVFGVIILLLLEKGALLRLARLSKGVNAIGASGDLSARVPVVGKDELASLAANINNMLEALGLSQRRRWESERRFRAIFEHALDPLIIMDDAGDIIEANPATRSLLGLPQDELFVGKVDDFIHSTHVDEDHQLSQLFLQHGAHLGELRIVRKDGEIREVEFYTKSNFLTGYHLVAIRDVTDRKRLAEQLEHQAFHDPLTDLPNRALFMDRLAHALTRAGRRADSVGVLFLDLDDFKVVNDSLGHNVGDQLLVSVGERLNRCIRAGDTVARLGGDEFTILVENITRVSDIIIVTERIAEQMQTPFHLGGAEVFISTSIGVAISASSQERPDDLLRNADMAMYEAKSKGKARYAAFDPIMDTRAWERLQMETDLRRAIERNEFRVHYQPVVELQTGRIVEVEALVRWQHPQRGLISPADFIPLAEQTGLIVSIGQWVLKEACRQVRAWQEEWEGDQSLMLSVNLSARQFQENRLVDNIAHVLKETGLGAQCLKLEITESVALDSTGPTLTTFEELKALGLQLAIDDFGTGYSALSYLKRYPIDTLKLDCTFTGGLGRDAEDTAIVHAVIAFAQALNLSVIAEGIETAEQLAHLKSLGCDRGQGYYFSKPLPAELMTPLFATTFDTKVGQEESYAL